VLRYVTKRFPKAGRIGLTPRICRKCCALYILAYIVVGVLTGLLAGLLGVGGGLVIVPLLVFCFTQQSMPQDVIMHLALGTSLATIVFTSVSSFTAHHRRGGVDWRAFRRIVPGIVLGTLSGTVVASSLPTGPLKGLFACFLLFVAVQMLIDKKPRPSRDLPGWWPMSAVGAVIGFVSSLVGIGGGTLSVPFLIWCQLTVHRAIGTSAAIGFPIAVAGSLGYLANGWGDPQLPAGAVGYVYVPALLCIAATSVLVAPLGVRLAHTLPVRPLRRAFAVLLVVLAARMLWSLF